MSPGTSGALEATRDDLIAAKRGDLVAMSRVVECYQDRLRFMAYGECRGPNFIAEDLVSLCLNAVIEAVQLNINRGKRRFWPFLKRVAQFRIMGYFQKRKKFRKREVLLNDILECESENVDMPLDVFDPSRIAMFKEEILGRIAREPEWGERVLQNGRMRYCKRGHLMRGHNVITRPSGIARECRECKRWRKREVLKRNRKE